MHPELAPSSHVDSFTRDNLPPANEWPAFVFSRPEVIYPEQINAVAQWLDQAVADGHGARPALVGIEEGEPFAWTYAELLQRVTQIGHVLTHDCALVPGQRVLLRGANTPMMAACLLAVMRAGLVAVPTMPLLRATELRVIVDKAQIDVALYDAQLPDELSPCMAQGQAFGLRMAVPFRANSHSNSLEARMAAHPNTGPAHPAGRDDVCLIAFTSGTTGKPKGTMHFQRDLLAMCDLVPRHLLAMGPDDVVCGTPPLAFTFGLGGLLAFPLHWGASTILLEKHTPETLLQTVQRFGATQIYTAPTFYRQMAELAPRFNLSSLRQTISAGEALPDATRTAWRQASGIEMVDGLGGTEMIHIYLSSASADVRPGAIGRVLPGYEAMVVDDNMQPVPPGTVGRLAVRGPTGCKYLNDSRQTDYVQQGWNLPGDSVRCDADGYYFYQARNDDMIISAGYNIAGPEVEDALLTHPAVAECAVVGLPDEARGQIVCAHVVLKPNHQANDALAKALQDHVKQTIAPFKYPRKVVFVAQLPRTETGKLQRFKLRQAAAS